MSDQLLTQKELAEVLPISSRQIRTLTAKDVLVTESLGARTLYPLAENVRRYIDYREKLAAGQRNDAHDARARKLAAEARIAELDLARQEGELIPFAMYESRLGAILDRLRAKLLAAPGSWAPRLAGAKTIPDVMRRLKPLIAQILESLSEQDDGEDEETAAA